MGYKRALDYYKEGDCNTDVNAQNAASYTPLHLAARDGKEDIAIALIYERMQRRLSQFSSNIDTGSQN